MTRAHHRDSVISERFFFRDNVLLSDGMASSDSFSEKTLHEIINGMTDGQAGFPGLIPLIRRYLESQEMDEVLREKLNKYLDFVSRRASGESETAAKWMREFVRSHPDYQLDSRVSSKTVYEMCQKMQTMTG